MKVLIFLFVSLFQWLTCVPKGRMGMRFVVFLMTVISFGGFARAEMTREGAEKKWPASACYGEYIAHFPYGTGCQGSLLGGIDEGKLEVRKFFQLINGDKFKLLYDDRAFMRVSDGFPEKGDKRQYSIYVPLNKVPEILKQAFLLEYDEYLEQRPLESKRDLPEYIANGMVPGFLKQRDLHNNPVRSVSYFIDHVLDSFFAKGRNKLSYSSYLLQTAILSILIERSDKFSADRILDYYFDSVYFGGGRFGIASASFRFWGKYPDQLSISQMALLAVMARGARFYGQNGIIKKEVVTLRDRLLDKMVAKGVIAKIDAKRAKAEVIVVKS